jgi:hypothetical protein
VDWEVSVRAKLMKKQMTKMVVKGPLKPASAYPLARFCDPGTRHARDKNTPKRRLAWDCFCKFMTHKMVIKAFFLGVIRKN